MPKVYVWDANLGGSTSYAHPTRIRATQEWGGASGQVVAHTQRSRVEVSGEIVRTNAPDFDIMVDRLNGGLALAGIWDFELRVQNGWDLAPAIDSAGNEFWRADGHTSVYNGEAANPPTGPWRSIFAKANGATAAEATSLPVDGLLDSEVIPKGTWVRHGDYRYRTLSAVTANASGEATLSLAKPLQTAVANNDDVRIPGDFFIGRLITHDISAADVDGLRTFQMLFREVYEDEETDDTVSPSVLLEWVVD